MSNQQVMLFDGAVGAVSKKFQPLVAAGVGNDLGDGIKGSYGIVGIKAGKFRLKYKGEETVLLNPDGTPVGYIDVVIVKANGFLNKQYFEGKYQEGVTAPPVCYSLDGVKPSDASAKKQAVSCALCPKNQFGSLIGDNGTKQKACRDTKKLAVVPLADIRNATMGGAMLFRVPPSSLKDLSAMADALKGRGYPYNSVAVRISFDLEASHPKPIFKAIRALDDNEAEAVLEMFESDSVLRVLADNDVVADHGEAAVAAPAPTAPAGAPAPRAPVSVMPTPEETRPVPQAPARPPVMPPAPSAADIGQIGTVMVQPVGPTPMPAFTPPPVEASPRVLHVQPDAPAAPAANPFAKAPAAPPPAAAAAPAANPFAAPPAAAPKARTPRPAPVAPAEAAPVVVEGTVVDAPAQPTQLTADISNILAGLDMG